MSDKRNKALVESEDRNEALRRIIVSYLAIEAMYPREIVVKLEGWSNLVSVRARLTELHDKGLVEIATIFGDQNPESCYRLAYAHEKDEIKQKREDKRWNKWLKNADQFQHKMPSEVMRWIQLEAML
jgi:hypothetical protein